MSSLSSVPENKRYLKKGESYYMLRVRNVTTLIIVRANLEQTPCKTITQQREEKIETYFMPTYLASVV